MIWNFPLGDTLAHKKSRLFWRQDLTWQARLASNSLYYRYVPPCLALKVHFFFWGGDASEFQTRVLWVLNLCKYLKAEDRKKKNSAFL